MKQCPKCQSIYTDDSLSYCLQDGTKLATLSDSAAAEVTRPMSGGGVRDLPPTEILRPEDMPTARIESAPSTTEQRRARPTAVNSAGSEGAGAAQTHRSNATVIALSIVVAVLLLALGGLVTWMAMRDKGQTDPRAVSSNSNQTEARQSNTQTTRANSNATPAVTPTAQASPVDVAAAQREVQAALNAWADTIRQRNLEEHMKCYADVLDVYYNASNVAKSRVRSDRSAAFSKYTSMNVELSNIKISVEPSGARATATFDKTFDFHGDKDFSGSGLNRFWFVKTQGRWLINGEKDLQTYYINK